MSTKTLVLAPFTQPLRVKKGCGQRKSRRDKDGRTRHLHIISAHAQASNIKQ